MPLKDREKRLAYMKKYMKEYYQKNIEKYKETDKIRYMKNREKHKIRMKKYYQNNKEKIDQQHKEWAKNNPKKTLEMMRKHSTKRRRNLGYNPLNTKFPDSVGHHINRSDVIYIPEELHKSIPHSVLNDQNMEKMNQLAFEFIGGDSFCPSQ